MLMGLLVGAALAASAILPGDEEEAGIQGTEAGVWEVGKGPVKFLTGNLQPISREDNNAWIEVRQPKVWPKSFRIHVGALDPHYMATYILDHFEALVPRGRYLSGSNWQQNADKTSRPIRASIGPEPEGVVVSERVNYANDGRVYENFKQLRIWFTCVTETGETIGAFKYESSRRTHQPLGEFAPSGEDLAEPLEQATRACGYIYDYVVAKADILRHIGVVPPSSSI